MRSSFILPFFIIFLGLSACVTPRVETHIFALRSPATEARWNTGVGIYTGTFDPIHLGHLEAAESMADAVGVTHILIIPNLDPKGKSPVPVADRYRLLELAIKDRPHFELLPYDQLMSIVESPSPVDSAYEWIAVHHPEIGRKQIFHFMGSDSYLKFIELPIAGGLLKGPKHRQYVVLERGDFQKPKAKIPNVIFVKPRFDPETSSSRYRRDPLLQEDILPRAVAIEIKKKHLYGRGGERGLYDLPEWLTEMIHSEQWENQKIEDVTKFASIQDGNSLPHQYWPETRPIFKMYTVDVPKENVVSLVKAGTDLDQIEVIKGGRAYIRFFIHPFSKSLFETAFASYSWSEEYLATPLASFRSLIVWNPNTNETPLSLKVSLNATIGEVVRNLGKGQIERSFAVSALLGTIPKTSLAAEGIFFLDEPAGFYINEAGLKVGFSTREIPVVPVGMELMPMFTLYSKPAYGIPPIVRMLRSSGLSPKEFLEKTIIRRMVDHAAFLAFTEGLVGEPHEQNVMIELKDGMPTGNFWYKDLAGFTVNPEYRNRVAKNMEWLPKEISMSSLKIERSDFMGNAKSYLLASNFYALQKAVSPYYPEITSAWVAARFREAVSANVQRYFYVNETQLGKMEKIIQSPSKQFDCVRPFEVQ